MQTFPKHTRITLSEGRKKFTVWTREKAGSFPLMKRGKKTSEVEPLEKAKTAKKIHVKKEKNT